MQRGLSDSSKVTQLVGGPSGIGTRVCDLPSRPRHPPVSGAQRRPDPPIQVHEADANLDTILDTISPLPQLHISHISAVWLIIPLKHIIDPLFPLTPPKARLPRPSPSTAIS